MTQFPRRQFLSSAAAAAALALNPVASFAAPIAKKPTKKPVLMKLGCQTEPTERPAPEISRPLWRPKYLRLSRHRGWASLRHGGRTAPHAGPGPRQRHSGVDMTTPPFLASILGGRGPACFDHAR